MLLVQIDSNNYKIKASIQNKLILYFSTYIILYINFNLNIIFQIKISKN